MFLYKYLIFLAFARVFVKFWDRKLDKFCILTILIFYPLLTNTRSINPNTYYSIPPCYTRQNGLLQVLPHRTLYNECKTLFLNRTKCDWVHTNAIQKIYYFFILFPISFKISTDGAGIRPNASGPTFKSRFTP